MATKKLRRQHSVRGFPDGRRLQSAPSSVDTLAFKYMELCKVESSTDSESDISPRWSDTSTMGCASSTPEIRPVLRMLPCSHTPVARYLHHSLFLDPYDGSSEDSDECVSVSGGGGPRRPRQGSCRFWYRSRRGTHHPGAVLREEVKSGVGDDGAAAEQQAFIDVQMMSASDSELWVCHLETTPPPPRSGRRGPTVNMSADSGVHATPSPCAPGPLTPVGVTSFQLPGSSSEKSPHSTFPLKPLPKRKLLCLPGAEGAEGGNRKKQCVSKMEARDPPPDVC